MDYILAMAILKHSKLSLSLTASEDLEGLGITMHSKQVSLLLTFVPAHKRDTEGNSSIKAITVQLDNKLNEPIPSSTKISRTLPNTSINACIKSSSHLGSYIKQPSKNNMSPKR